jgi:hypothetical protein
MQLTEEEDKKRTCTKNCNKENINTKSGEM